MPHDMRGFYFKYNIYRRKDDGSNGPRVDGPTFTLRPYDPHARAALRAYAESVEGTNADLARDLRKLCEDAESGEE